MASAHPTTTCQTHRYREQARSHKELHCFRGYVSSPDSIHRLIKVHHHVFLTDLHSFWSLPMPLVRVDIQKHRDPTHARRIGQLIYAAMRQTIGVPEHDNFQILAEHDEQHFIFDPEYLGINRTDNLVVIQITLNEGRTLEQKKNLYKTIAESLNAELAVRLEDVFINLVEVKKENWSFGNGIAQYAL
jgi:phenylpyruvate tautomerase PptA (4-oxalocrotonate tautomerase family)